MPDPDPNLARELVIKRAGPDDAQEIIALFQQSGVPCFCQYFGFAGDHRDWQNRCANEPDANQTGLRRDLGRPDFVGLIARSPFGVVGWLRMAPPIQLEKTYQNRLYKNLPCFDERRGEILAIGCFLVLPSERRRGVARALLRVAIARARDLEAAALEAFPRGATDVSDEEQWTGPLALYRSLGFQVVHDFAPYPVLRLAL